MQVNTYINEVDDRILTFLVQEANLHSDGHIHQVDNSNNGNLVVDENVNSGRFCFVNQLEERNTMKNCEVAKMRYSRKVAGYKKKSRNHALVTGPDLLNNN